MELPVTQCQVCTAPTDNAPLDGEFLCDACIRARAEYMDGGPAPVVPGDKGAVSWERREPRKRRDEHHWLPIVIGGQLYFQRSPPCHVNGSPPRSDTGGHKTVSTTISEAEAQRRALAIGFEHMSRAEQAEALGMTPRQLRRRIERHNRGRR